MFDDYSTEDGLTFARAHEDDPRVVLVATTDAWSEPPEDEGVASAVLGGRYVSQDTDLAEQVNRAWDHSNDHGFVERYLRIFCGYEAVGSIDYGSNGEATLYVAIEEGSGFTDPADGLAGALKEWEAYDFGDTYSIGVLVNLNHTLAFEADEDLPTDEGDGWEFEDGSLIHGFYGDEHATEALESEGKSAVELLARTVPLIAFA